MVPSPSLNPRGRAAWIPLSQEPGHPLAALEAVELAGHPLSVLLGPTSRFGARYFALKLADANGEPSQQAVLTGMHNSGPLITYNWIEVAETNDRVTLADGGTVEISPADQECLFGLLLALLPAGGHIMVEYDSPQRAETARALALNVPAIASPLGALLFRIGCGAHFKDWQIAEGGSEGPRKLQAYKPLSPDDAIRWKREAVRLLEAFIARPPSSSDVVRAARERAQTLLPSLAIE